MKTTVDEINLAPQKAVSPFDFAQGGTAFRGVTLFQTH
jgi:hypothetical protein